MRPWLLLTALALGCTQLDPSGDPTAPVAVQAATSSGGGTAPAPTEPQGDFDFEAEDAQAEDLADPDADDAPVEGDDLVALQAKMLGLSAPPAAPATPEPTPAAPAAVAPAMVAPAAPAPMWDPASQRPIKGSFGITVVDTRVDLQPPEARIILPNGERATLTPGDMVPQFGVVLLAVGRDAVQIATVSPEGYYATVTPQTVAVLSPVVPAP